MKKYEVMISPQFYISAIKIAFKHVLKIMRLNILFALHSLELFTICNKFKRKVNRRKQTFRHRSV